MTATIASSRSAGTFETGYSIGTLIPMLAIVVIYFLPIYYLFMFSKHMKLGIQMLNSSEVSLALKYLKQHYRFMGILIIVVISIYIVVIIAAIAFWRNDGFDEVDQAAYLHSQAY